MEPIKFLIERGAFGVCTYLGEKMGISTTRIRLFFLYASFAAFGSPVILYLIMAFWMNMRHYLRERRRSIWDL